MAGQGGASEVSLWLDRVESLWLDRVESQR